MRQGIVTKYLGPTNYKGSRIKAIARKASENYLAQQLTLPKDYALNYDADHCRVAKALADRLGWRGYWMGGGTPDETGYQWVCIGDFIVAPNPDVFGVEGCDWFYVESCR